MESLKLFCYFNLLDDHLLVGTRQGHLMMYRVTINDEKPEIELIRYNKTFSKKPIQQLEVIPEYQLLVSLTGMFSILFASIRYIFYYLNSQIT